CGNPALKASGRPSDDTTTACATSGTRSTKLVISQPRSCAAGRPGVLIRTPLVARSALCLGLYSPSVLRLLDLRCGGGNVAPASVEACHPVAGCFRRSGGNFGSGLLTAAATAGAGAAHRTRHEVSPR